MLYLLRPILSASSSRMTSTTRVQAGAPWPPVHVLAQPVVEAEVRPDGADAAVDVLASLGDT